MRKREKIRRRRVDTVLVASFYSFVMLVDIRRWIGVGLGKRTWGGDGG